MLIIRKPMLLQMTYVFYDQTLIITKIIVSGINNQYFKKMLQECVNYFFPI